MFFVYNEKQNEKKLVFKNAVLSVRNALAQRYRYLWLCPNSKLGLNLLWQLTVLSLYISS